jgi:hypothetical protein
MRIAATIKQLVLGISVTVAMLLLGTSSSYAGDYTCKVTTVTAFVKNGVAYGGIRCGNYSWALPVTWDRYAPFMTTVQAAYIKNTNIMIGCATCTSFTAWPTPNAEWTFWYPDYAMAAN